MQQQPMQRQPMQQQLIQQQPMQQATMHQQPMWQPMQQPPMANYHQWNSGMSPHPYTLCELPNAAKKCYGCGEEFAEKYRLPPTNIVVRHVDRRIRKRDESGLYIYSLDYSIHTTIQSTVT